MLEKEQELSLLFHMHGLPKVIKSRATWLHEMPKITKAGVTWYKAGVTCYKAGVTWYRLQVHKLPNIEPEVTRNRLLV